MAKQTRTTLKSYFNTDDVPTESQFADFIDSAVNKTDDVPTGIIKGSGGELSAAVADTDYLTPGTASTTYVPKTVTVNGHALSGNVSVTTTDLGLNNVDNTSDATKNSATATLTNKRITARVTTITSHATPTINTDDCDAVTITAQAEAITSMTTNLSGTPTNFQKLIIRIKDNGTARAITWGASFEAKGVALPTTTVISKVLTVGFIYDTVTSKWGCVASAQEA